MSIPHELNDLHGSESLGPAFLGLQLFQLLTLIDHQGGELLARRSMAIPPRSGSTLVFLHRVDTASVSELAAFLGMSHQLASHRVKDLQQRGLLEQSPDPDDARKKVLCLSDSGRRMAGEIGRLSDALEPVFKGLFDEIGCNLLDTVILAKSALARRSLADRLDSN